MQAKFAFLSVVLLGVSSPASAARFLEWYCGDLSINCSPDAKNPIQVLIDDTQKPPNYGGTELAVESSVLPDPEQPRFDHEFAFSFMSNSFANIIDKSQNNQNISSTKVCCATTEKLADGLTQVTFYTFYAKNALPKDFTDYLGSEEAAGYVTVDFDPEADVQGRRNIVFNADVVIQPTPEPTTMLLVGGALLLLGGARRKFGRDEF